MLDVRISWLRTFVAVAEERHFGRAASLVGHSASAVSRHVRRLEAAVGAALFERTTRTVVLTPAGRRLYHEVAAPVDALGRALGDAAAAEPAITIGYVGAAADHLVPDLAGLWSCRSDIELHLVPASSSAQLDAIATGAMDVGLQWIGPRDPDLALTRLLTEPLRVARPASSTDVEADHAPPVARAGRVERAGGAGRAQRVGCVELDELADATWLMAADRTDRVVRDHLRRICAARGFTPRIKDAATGHAAQLHLVAAGRGVCLVPPTAIGTCRDRVTFSTVDGEHVDLVAVTRPHPRAAVRELVDLLVTTATLEPHAAGHRGGDVAAS